MGSNFIKRLRSELFHPWCILLSCYFLLVSTLCHLFQITIKTARLPCVALADHLDFVRQVAKLKWIKLCANSSAGSAILPHSCCAMITELRVGHLFEHSPRCDYTRHFVAGPSGGLSMPAAASLECKLCYYTKLSKFRSSHLVPGHHTNGTRLLLYRNMTQTTLQIAYT